MQQASVGAEPSGRPRSLTARMPGDTDNTLVDIPTHAAPTCRRDALHALLHHGHLAAEHLDGRVQRGQVRRHCVCVLQGAGGDRHGRQACASKGGGATRGVAHHTLCAIVIVLLVSPFNARAPTPVKVGSTLTLLATGGLARGQDLGHLVHADALCIRRLRRT